jgi:hypothetical protein
MKRTSQYLKIVAIAVALAFGATAYAETAREELVHAHHLLKEANRDYMGHRVKAMAETEAALRDMGVSFRDYHLPEGEPQWESDKKVREARRILIEARDKLEAGDREHAAARIEHAIKEIDRALEAK